METFEDLTGYLGLKKHKNTKKLIFATKQSTFTGNQWRSNTIPARTSCLFPISDASKIEHEKDAVFIYILR